MKRVLDRLPSTDPRSVNYPIRTLLAQTSSTKPRSYTWTPGPVLDQGSEGACVGFGTSGELAARPVVVPNVDNAFAFEMYNEARQHDEWPGEDYEGTSVLGGMKAAQARGYYREYRWAENVDDLALAVGHSGPAVLGINWRDDMWDPDADGTLHVSGAVAGGHCIYTFGVSIRLKRFVIQNSWGPDWGKNGRAYISFDDMAKLLADDGEAAIPVGRALA